MLSIVFEGDQNFQITADAIIKLNYTCIVEGILSNQVLSMLSKDQTVIKYKRKHAPHFQVTLTRVHVEVPLMILFHSFNFFH